MLGGKVGIHAPQLLNRPSDTASYTVSRYGYYTIVYVAMATTCVINPILHVHVHELLIGLQ